MANVLTIDGLNECYRAFDGMPAAAVKVTKTALRDAAKPVTRQIRKGTPARWRKLVRSKVSSGMTLRGGMVATVGLWNNHQKTNSKAPFDWFKAYWANYGTLKHRDPSHQFMYKIKPHAKRRNNEGQYPQNFFEAASQGVESLFLDKFVESFQKNQSQLIK